MSVLIVDIADEIYRELAEPEDISIPSIGFWLRTNIGKLNIVINKKYTINTLDLEVDAINPDTFTLTEKAIFKKLYTISYYDRQIVNLIGKSRNINLISTDSSISGINNADSIQISENGFTYQKSSSTKTANETIKANTQFIRQLGLNFVELKKQEMAELKILVDSYNLNDVGPLQVAGDDTIQGLDNSYNYGSPFIRNLDNL
jgi:hypothetical protein